MSSERRPPGRERFQRLSRLFDELTAVEAHEHDALIARRCVGDAQLADDVRALLDIDGTGAADRWLGDVLASEGAALRESLEHGRAIGPWRAVRRVARTSGWASYLAERRLDDGVVQAIVHLFRGGGASDHRLARFWHACGRVNALDPDGRARFVGSGVTEDGAPYVASEVVVGRPLVDWCARRAVALHARIEMLRRACDVLGGAHALGIAHGSLGPSRLLADESGSLVVRDLGLAHVGAAWRGGTPPRAIDDVRALGAVLELLVGCRLADGALGRIDRAADLEARLGLEGGLDAVARRALRPADRAPYPTASALAEDLRRWLRGAPVLVDFRPGELRRPGPMRESGPLRRT